MTACLHNHQEVQHSWTVSDVVSTKEGHQIVMFVVQMLLGVFYLHS